MSIGSQSAVVGTSASSTSFCKAYCETKLCSCHELVLFDYVILPAPQNPSKVIPTSTASSFVPHLSGKLLNKIWLCRHYNFGHNAVATSISNFSQPVHLRAVGTTSQSTPATTSCKPDNHISVCYVTFFFWIQLHTCHTSLNMYQYLASQCHLSLPLVSLE